MDNWRWAGVPFYMRVGKRLAKGGTEIAVQFKDAPPRALQQPRSDRSVRTCSSSAFSPTKASRCACSAKMPGTSLRIEPVKMDFHYGTSFGKASPEAYERLLLDAMSGDATLFARRDEVEEAWKFIDAIRAEWDRTREDLALYAAGTWGPTEADELLKRYGATWRRL